MDSRTSITQPSKHRIPRPRREAVPRPALLARTLERAADARLVLVQATAGFGETTLLVQLAAALAAAPGGEVVWVSLDAEDNDANRLFAALFGALAALELSWAAPPATVLAQLQDPSPAARTALGPLIDALGSRPGARIALVLDDLHQGPPPGSACRCRRPGSLKNTPTSRQAAKPMPSTYASSER
jgi:LuxR family maltose regulon positive regulatory protein